MRHNSFCGDQRIFYSVPRPGPQRSRRLLSFGRLCRISEAISPTSVVWRLTRGSRDPGSHPRATQGFLGHSDRGWTAPWRFFRGRGIQSRWLHRAYLSAFLTCFLEASFREHIRTSAQARRLHGSWPFLREGQASTLSESMPRMPASFAVESRL